ncbi:hypothetical protein B0T12DRAFT_343466 [Alternaria alternata]|nr:hypothetical protein B0T12DRAFT_343466 [Alternaria alternata]
MSSNTYKGGLSVGGSALDKSKLQLRRPTPDSDVLASSDDDREHVAVPVRHAPGTYPLAVRRPSSGWLQDIQPNRKFSLPSVSFAGSQPTTPSLELPQQSRPSTSSFPWNTPSFSGLVNNRSKNEIAPSPTSAFPPTDNKPIPSPTTIEGDDGNGIGFLLNQQAPNPFRKAVRSQSYSIGQGDIEHSPVSRFSRNPNTSANLRHRPSKPSLLGESAVGLSQLREDEADEIESSNGSEHGVRLPAGYWEREQKQALLKQAAMENARARNRATSTGSPVKQMQQQRRQTTAGLRNTSYNIAGEYAIEELDDAEPPINRPAPGLTRRFSEHVGVLTRDHEVEIVDSPQKPQWTTGNISPAEMDPLGRRHSFAHYGSYNSAMPLSTLSNTQEEEEEYVSPRQTPPNKDDEPFDASAYFTGYGPASRAINSSAISAAHPDPVVPNPAMSANPYAVPPRIGNPTRRLFIVTFKCSRADIYYLYDNTGLEIRRGDLVITEGDRGCDLGQITHADLTMEEAKKLKAEANEEHFRWLVMFSQYSLAGTQNDSGMLGALARANGFPNPMSRTPVTASGEPEPFKPKMIKRLAQAHEISALREKEGGEAKAKRLGAQKAADHKLPMEILDAEYQADYHKLTYFYYAESYVNFNELVTDLFKQYKVRIWMSAVNPASVINPAGGAQIPPPSAIGPGAIIKNSNQNAPPSVGPGFGNNTHHTAQQYGQARNHGNYGNYDDGFHAFSHQIPAYPTQPSYNMQQTWAHGQQMGRQQMYPGYYPNVTASGSPMNYGGGGYYPPSTYASSYGGGYGTATTTAGYAASRSYTSNTGQSFGVQQPSSYTSGAGYANAYGNASYTSGAPGGYYGTSGGHGNGNPGAYNGANTATSGGRPTTGTDPALLSGMQNMSFGN